MRKFATLFLACLLSGCLTDTSSYSRDCMAGYTLFADQVACMRDGIDGNIRLRNDDAAQDYVHEGEHLLKEKKAGKITEDEARQTWARKLHDLNMKEAEALQRQEHEAHAYDYMQPPSCRRAGNTVQYANNH